MTIWDPWREFSQIEREMRRFFDEFWGGREKVLGRLPSPKREPRLQLKASLTVKEYLERKYGVAAIDILKELGCDGVLERGFYAIEES